MPSADPKPLTIQKVSAVLRKAGFKASKRSTTRIPGWYDYSTGYRLHARMDGGVSVLFSGHWSIKDEDRHAHLNRWMDALSAAGLAVEKRGEELVVYLTP